MRRRGRRSSRCPTPARALFAVAPFLLAGCSSLPGDGTVTRVRQVVDPGSTDRLVEPPVRRVFDPAAPTPGATPAQIVSGFLAAHVDPAERARLFLAPETPWVDTGVTVVDGEPEVSVQVTADSAVAIVTAKTVAIVSPRGEYEPRSGTYRERMTLRHIRDEWRLTEVPRGLLLPEERFRDAYSRTPLYFPDTRRRLLVPEPFFFSQVRNPAAPVLAALLAGPSRWLEPAVRTAIPPGTRLVSPLVVVNTIADVNLSREADTAPADTRAALVAQIAWTLTEGGLGVSGVRLRVEGRPFALQGIDTNRVHDKDDWAAFGAEPAPDDTRLFFVRNGSLYGLDPELGPPMLVRASVAGAARVAVSPRGARLAGTVPTPNGREALVIGPLAEGDLRKSLEADSLTDPTWAADGTSVWTVRRTGGVSEIVSVAVATGMTSVVRADLGGPVTALRLSPEGSRVALVRGAGPARRLLVGRIEPVPSGLAVTGLRVVVPQLADVSAVSWDDATRLQVVGRVGSSGPSLYRVEVDGYELAPDPIDRLPGVPSTVATAPGRITYVEVGGTIYRRANQGVWAEQDEGTSPIYAG